MQKPSRCRDAHPRRRLVHRLLVFLKSASTLIPLVAPLGVAHAAEERDETERWVPSFGLYFDVTRQKVEGSITISDVLGPPLTTGGCLRFGVPSGSLCDSPRANPEKILPDEEGNDTSITPLVGASLELMTPSLIDGFLRPRLFVRGDAAAAFGFERKIAGAESPGAFALPDGITLRPGETAETFPLPELSIKGQGSRAKYQVRRLVVSGAAGFALSLDVFDRRLRIKPSFEYLRQEVDLIGAVHRAVGLAEPSGLSLANFRLLTLTRVEKQVQEGFGGGLELEVDTARLGPFQTSVYAMGRVVRFVGDLEETLTATNEYGETASWHFDPEKTLWRTGVGFRLRWLPE